MPSTIALYAQLLAEGSPLFRRLDDFQRLSVVSGLAVVLIAAGFLIMFTVASARIARWYVNKRPSRTRHPGDIHQPVIDRKPRPWRHENENWQQQP